MAESAVNTAHDTTLYPHWCPECRHMVEASKIYDEASAVQDHYQQKAKESQ